MNCKIGTLDRILRVAVGAVLVALGVLRSIESWGFIGLAPLLTGIVGNCPAYPLFEVRTCPNAAAGAGSR